MKAVPKLQELSASHEGQLVLIGVHTKNGAEKMPAFVKEKGIGYPVAVDREGATVAAFAVDSFPDYYVIDRAGNLRFADLANGELDRALEMLLAEPAPDGTDAAPAVHPALAEAAAVAVRKDKRILVAWDGAPVAALTQGDRDLATLLRNEYELVALRRVDHPELAASFALGGATGGALTALRADGGLLGTRGVADLAPDELRTFLEVHRVPQKDAQVLWRDALAQAERENKRILVHLGAPW